MIFLSILLELLSGTPHLCSLSEGALALTSAGAKHLTVVTLQPLDPLQGYFGLFLEKKTSSFKTLIFPGVVLEQQEKIISHIVVQVFIFKSKANLIGEKVLLDPPVKISLPGLHIMRRNARPRFYSNKGDSRWPRGPPSAPLCTDPSEGPHFCAAPDPGWKVKPHVP